MDGKIHRVKTNNDKGRELSGAYRIFWTIILQGLCNFKTGIKENWKMPIEKIKAII
ncbi:hypothetical protein UXU46_00840 (plasmid) [Campylobacter jejuni]